jgi:hypothetical protein
LADNTIVTYFQVVKAVVASALSKEGEQLHSRNWNLDYISLPIVNERKQIEAREPTSLPHSSFVRRCPAFFRDYRDSRLFGFSWLVLPFRFDVIRA